MTICKRCVLDDKFPGIQFNGEGICNFCATAKNLDELAALRDKYARKFQDLIEQNQGRGSYDCLIAYSGGKDSTYTLALMTERYQLRTLAFSFNNWFQSDFALRNIANVIRYLKVDHISFTPHYEVFKKMIVAARDHTLQTGKAMQRASSICTNCISLIRALSLKTAIEKGIPFVIFGMSPGQAPIPASIFKSNTGMLRAMQQAITHSLHEHLGPLVDPYYLEERHFQEEHLFPYIVNPLAFLAYDEQDIYERIQKMGWIAPSDTDANSTNCLLNAYANKIHEEQYGFNPYAYEIANLVREGFMSRDEGLARLRKTQEDETIGYIKEELWPSAAK